MPAPIKVLCVDDNRETAGLVGQILKKAGCEVRICHDAPSALSTALDFQPDVCVIDLILPGMDGTELALRLREERGDNPPRCIALTGQWDIECQHRTHNVGFAEHLVKPVESDRLIHAVFNRAAYVG
jgi:two-component system, OmpR family, response regulator